MDSLLVADSFRVRSNPKTGAAEVRGFAQHLDRFKWAALEAWCGPHVPTADERARHAAALQEAYAQSPMRDRRARAAVLVWVEPDRSPAEQRALARIDEFLDSVPERIARFGEGWPRMEIGGDPGRDPEPRLELRLRPLPALGETLDLRTAGRVRSAHPRRKGPNISRYAELNSELGAEALLTDAHGRVREGATTSLIWWLSGGEEQDHGFVAASTKRVPSVTEALLLEAADRRLVGTKPNRRRIGQPQPARLAPVELAQHEVWAVNALHGIRVVTSIDGTPLPPPDERRLQWFREALDRTWEAVAG